MAIIRCPYCHAIIDENDKYCNNCGTQLLFPEDDAVEEEIPGEKIVDAEEEEEEKDYEVPEPGKEPTAVLDEDEEEDEEEERTGELVTGPVEEGEGGGIRELLEDQEPDEDEELESDEDETREVVVVEGPEAGEPVASAALAAAPPATEVKSSGPEEETRAYPVRPAVKEVPEDETQEMSVLPAVTETAKAPAPADDMPLATEPRALPATILAEDAASPKDKDVAGHPPVPVTFDTRELEGIGRTVDLSKERLDKRIEVMAEKRKERAPEPAPPPPERTTGTLPPWADKIRGGDAAVEREDTRDTGRRFEKGTWAGPAGEGPALELSAGAAGEELPDKEEVEIFPRGKRPDSGIGLPEGVTQADLPFGPGEAEAAEDEEAEEEAGAMEAEAFERVTAPPEAARPGLGEARPAVRPEAPPETGFGRKAEPEEEIPRPPFNFSVFLKAKSFDFLFIGVFWLVALWVAARSMDATLFELLSVTSTPVLLLYAVFIGLYFFLFKFFLGETLGDRLFKERE